MEKSQYIKPRMQFAIRRIELQKQKLESALERFTQRDKAIFARIVDANMKHDVPRANVFSNELVEVRKLTRLILKSKLALEQVIVRLHSTEAENLGDAVVTLAAVVVILRSVRHDLVSVFPEAEGEIGELGNSLSGIVIEVGLSSGAKLDFNSLTYNTNQTIMSIDAAAEQKMKDTFPDLDPDGYLAHEKQRAEEKAAEEAKFTDVYHGPNGEKLSSSEAIEKAEKQKKSKKL